MKRPKLSDSDLVFGDVFNRPILPERLSHAWRKLADKVGLPNIRLHDCRHTHATLLLKQGVNPKVIGERLSHANISTTLNTYAHVLPTMQKDVAAQFDGLFSRGTMG